jgi:hypothetical protein
MKLNSNGVFISILILILMILICHTMNYLYPKNRFANIPKTTNYNKIYYTNQNEKISCDHLKEIQAEVPCDVIKTCNDEDQLNLNTLSDSEIAYFYKVAYEEAAREIFMRTLNEN